MEAIEFARELGRMCVAHKYCEDCPIDHSEFAPCPEIIGKAPEDSVSVVEQWSKYHPRRTYLSVLLERFPNTKLDEERDNLPEFCPDALFGGECWEYCESGVRCIECWSREYREES